MNAVVPLTGICLLAVAVLVWAEFRRSQPVRALTKLVASSAFVAIAWQLDAAASRHGRWLLAAFALSWVGDALLLSARSRVFLVGLFAFLAAHVAFAGAFLILPQRMPALWAAVVALAASGLLMLRWLWPHLKPVYRPAVTAYVAALVAMAAPAISATAAGGDWRYAAGALAFAASDVAVARNRFVAPGPANKACGLPLYYAAQVMFALSLG
ncbi:lysoplasmalogenase [Thermomonas fusca]|uniref:Lysoplasmalogenase n=1 Tax=Thermomonas fusca TaxID=215690 RepID=A0A5R9PDL4_9GAMM|nr:lysoplasmalogenase [Thermomonas fusca]TLX21599.1 lysoplasmalogenase [Thermomonas fusca]